MSAKIFKNLIPVLLILAVAGIFVWQRDKLGNKQVVQAKQGVGTVYVGMVCDEPIPIGETTANTQALIKQVQDYYDNTRTVLDMSIQDIKLVLSVLSQHQQGVCDFKNCQADVTDKGVDAGITVETYVTQPIKIEGHAPNCQAEPAKGQPCPDIAQYVKEFDQQKESLALYRQQVKEIFSNPTIPLPDDLKKSGDTKLQKVTLPELIRRNAELTEAWFTSTAGQGNKQSCALSYNEQQLVAKGKMGDRVPTKCRDAIENGWYWLKPDSPFCLNACKDGLNEPCRNCLATDPGPNASVLAKVNYQIFGVCKDKCKNELTYDCEQCICSREDGSVMTSDECLDRLCGDRENYICCHQNPLEIQYYIADYTEPLAGVTPEILTDFSSYSPPMFLKGQLTKSGKGVGTTFGPLEGNLGDLAVDTSVIPLGTCIKIKEVVDINKFPSARGTVAKYNLQEMSFCASDTGDPDHIKGNRIDMWLPIKQEADDWGRRKVKIAWWYSPGNKCYKDPSFCDNEPAPGSFGNVSVENLKFNFGNENQISDASNELRSLLNYIASNAQYPWVINSISDSEGMAKCAYGQHEKPPCSHAQYSCHYGGKKCKGASYAFDFEATGPDDKQAQAVAYVACQWGKANTVPVTAIYEEPSHYHVSIRNAEGDCDSQGEREGNICK